MRAAAPDDVWFAEALDILHWDGHSWTAFNFADPTFPTQQGSIEYFFSGLLVEGPNDVWVVGGSDVVSTTFDPAFLHHFDGTTWTHLQVWVFGVAAIARAGGPIWMAVPQLSTMVNGQDANVTLLRYQPGAADVEPVAIAGVPFMPIVYHSTQMTSLFARASDDVWAAGADVAHFDGQQWTLVPDVPDVTRTGNTDPGTYVTGDAHSVWLATGGRFFRMVD